MDAKYVNSALSSPASTATFALQMLRDKQKKLERGERMHSLWEKSGLPQKAIAKRIDLEHRSYQKALQTGGISYEKAELLAEVHSVDVDWLWSGRERSDAPAMNGNAPSDRLRAVEDRLDEVLGVLRKDVLPALTELEAAVTESRSEAGAPKKPRRRASGS